MKPYSSLNLPAGNSVLLVVVRESGSLVSNPLENIVHKGVHNAHSLGRDSSIRVDLLQDFIDVNRVTLLP